MNVLIKPCTNQLLVVLSTRTRPDIAFAVSKVARFCSKPTKEHWTAIKQIMMYLRGTTCCTPKVIQWNVSVTPMQIGEVTVMITNQRQAFSFKLVGQQQSCVALSTAEAEYMALTAAAQEAVWLRQLQSDLIKTSNSPMTIFEDNQSAICMAKNYVFHGRTKHIAREG